MNNSTNNSKCIIYLLTGTTKVVYLIFILFLLLSQNKVLSQSHISKNNYNGNWESPQSWDPLWDIPQTDTFDSNIIINGYISCNGSLIFSGNADTLFVNDTLIVFGDLIFGNNDQLVVNENAILIVRGNLYAGNKTNIKTNAYVVVTGNFSKGGAGTTGSFISSELPSNVFIGGSVQAGLDTSLYPVLKCPGDYPYPESECNYGNMTDIINDPINSFFESTCNTVSFTSSNLPMCVNESRLLTANIKGGTFTVLNGLALLNADTLTPVKAGIIVIKYTEPGGCHNFDTQTIHVNALPVPSIGLTESRNYQNDGNICLGDSVFLVANGGILYSWSSGENTSEITKDLTGKYTVTVTDTNGCKNSVATTISVFGLPVAEIEIKENSGISNNDGIICSGDEVTLSAFGGKCFSWSSGEMISEITKEIAGNYIVTVTDTNGCIATAQANINVLDLPTATIELKENSGISDNDGIICLGDEVTLTAFGGTSFSWSSGEMISEITKEIAGNYIVTVTDTNGCTGTAQANINVFDLPTATIELKENSGISDNDGIICSGDKVTLTAFGGTSFSWSSGEMISEITKEIAGNYIVTITDTNGCTGTAQANINVLDLPTATIELKENSGISDNDGIICSGDEVTLTAFGGTSFSWSSGEITSEITKENAGYYTVKVTDTNGCIDSASATVIVNGLPAAVMSITDKSGLRENDGIICSGDSAVLTIAGGTNCEWSSGEKSPSITKKISGQYTAVITDENGCRNSGSGSILMAPSPEVNAGDDAVVCGSTYILDGFVDNGTVTWSVISGPGTISFDPSANSPAPTIETQNYGTYNLRLTSNYDNCPAISEVFVTFNNYPVANAGEDQQLNDVYSFTAHAELSSTETGEWSVIDGSGNFDNVFSPGTVISGLSIGRNAFLWTVSSEYCSSSDTLIVEVNDLFVPQIITPNGDSKNDFFIIKDIEENGPAELIIFNRWGNEVYRNTNYMNDWDGHTNKGKELSSDTYFYTLKFFDGKITKGFVMIKK